MKKIFIMNLGTTSFKFKLFDFSEDVQNVIAEGEIESVGAAVSHYKLVIGNEEIGDTPIADHGAGFTFCLEKLQSAGLLGSLADLDAVGYKAVHGGNLSGTRIVDEALMAEMERVTPLAPAHNPIYLNAMRAIARDYPGLLQVARFETSFHATIPDQRTTYGVPYHWRTELGIRKFGFHGSSHEFIAGEIARLQPDARRVISCHLGGSSSLCAILDGKSIATSMGATLQSGVFQNNRVGDFDLFCLPMVLPHYDNDLDKVLKVLSKESGFLGLSQASNDLRLVIEAMENGSEPAKLAFETFADDLLGYIGKFAAYLGGVDALVFTGGIGTNSSLLRKTVCRNLGFLGIHLDEEKNAAGKEICISTSDSPAKVYRIRTNEELIVAKNVYAML